MKKFKVTEKSSVQAKGYQIYIRAVDIIAGDQSAAIDLVRENDLFDHQIYKGEVKEEFDVVSDHDEQEFCDYSAEEVGKATAEEIKAQEKLLGDEADVAEA